MGEQNGYMDTLSGNDVGDHETDETVSDMDTGDIDLSEEETPGQDEAADGSELDTGNDKEHDKEKDEEVSDRTEYEQIITVIEDTESAEWREGVTEQLAELMKPEDTTDVTERLDALIMLLTPEEEEPAEEDIGTYAVSVPFEGYESWEYPIGMQFQVYPYGLGNWMGQSETFYDPDSFVTRYEDIVSLCQEGGTLKDFYIEYIWEDYCGDDENLVYDYEAQTPEPEPEPGDEGQQEITDQLLAHLADINITLSNMLQTDMEYYQAVYDYQAEMLELQTANTASTMFICVGVFAILTVQLWTQFFGRFK